MKLRITGKVNGKDYQKKELTPSEAIKLFGLRLDLSRNIIFEVGSRLSHVGKYGKQQARGVRVLPYCRGVYAGEVIELQCFDRERSVPGTGGQDKILEPRRIPVMEGGSIGTFNIRSADDLLKATYFALHPYCETSPLRAHTDPVKFCYRDEAATAAQVMGRAQRRSENLLRIQGGELPPHLVRIVAEGAGIDTSPLSLIEVQARLLRISETDPATFDRLFTDANTISTGAIKRGNKTGAIHFHRRGGEFSVVAADALLDGIQQSGFTFLGSKTFPGKNEAVKALHLSLIASSESLHVLTELIRLADLTADNQLGPARAAQVGLMDSLARPIRAVAPPVDPPVDPPVAPPVKDQKPRAAEVADEVPRSEVPRSEVPSEVPSFGEFAEQTA